MLYAMNLYRNLHPLRLSVMLWYYINWAPTGECATPRLYILMTIPLKRFIAKLSDILISRHTWLSTGNEYSALPAGIRTTIKRQQDGSERLIGWIQLAILTSFAMLYLAVPKTAPTGAEFEPVPIFLSAYFVFTCLRLWMAYKTSLPMWFLIISIIMDMALLLGLIWSFHIQYMQPASFYLKAPTLLYIFIFISLRALRFEPGYVLLSGIIGSAGWLLLMMYAVFGEPENAVITRNYIEYLTSNSILIGGEIDKIMSIMVVTIVLTVAIGRARGLLIQAIVESSAAKNLSHFVPESVAAQIATSEASLLKQTETREASILFSDLVSFTSISEPLTPEQLITLVNEYSLLIDAPIKRNKGVIISRVGDAFMATYNLPSSNDDHAAAAIASALEIQALLSKHEFSNGIKLKARFGINTGNVVGGYIGTPDNLDYTLYGDNVNIAARLENLNKQHGTTILVAERTVELAGNRFNFQSKGSEVLRGRQASINIFTASPGKKKTD